MDQHVSPSYPIFVMVTPTYHSKVFSIGTLHAEKIAKTVLLDVFRITFPALLFAEIIFTVIDVTKSPEKLQR